MSHFGDKQQEELLVKLLDALRLNRSELQLTRDAPGTRARPVPAATGRGTLPRPPPPDGTASAIRRAKANPLATRAMPCHSLTIGRGRALCGGRSTMEVMCRQQDGSCAPQIQRHTLNRTRARARAAGAPRGGAPG